MAGFEGSALQQWQDQQASPAAPKGMRQEAGAARGYEQGSPGFENSALGQWGSQQGYVNTAQSWYTGANREGTANGWSTPFVNNFMDRWNTALDEGNASQYFSQDNATGVVTWDHTSDDGMKQFHFGDVYEDGHRVGNVFQQFDKTTANLMMSPYMLSADQKAQVFSESDPKSAIDQAVQAARQLNNTEMPKLDSQHDFNKGVKETQAGFQEGTGVDEAIAGGGALGGAAVGAGAGAVAGSAFFGVGAVPGALVGGLVGAAAGGIGAWLNRDALSEQAARAYEITALSDDQFGAGAGIATGVQQWSGFAGQLISPLQNTTKGLADAQAGRLGDGESAFYKMDATGKRVVPTWMKVADVGAAIGDSLLQFASPTGLALYSTQMSATIGGEVGELALTGGNAFDYNRGAFDNIFTDENGHFDASSAAAGIGKVGIDVAQLGLARGLAGKVDASRAAAGEAAAYAGWRSRIPGMAGFRGTSRAAAADTAEVRGFRYTLNEQGVATGRKWTLGLLAPSEQLAALETRVQALRNTARSGGALTADDFYRAANQLAGGERRIQTTLVTGMGEGYEEGVQQILDAHSHGHTASASDIANAALYGFAGGVGMGAGFGARMPSASEKQFAQAAMNHFTRTGGGELTRQMWDGMGETERATLVTMSPVEAAQAAATYKKLADDLATDATAGVEGVHKFRDVQQSLLVQNLTRSTPRTDGAFAIIQIEHAGQVDDHGNLSPDSMPADAIGSSAMQLAANLSNHMRGVQEQVEKLTQDVADATAQLASSPADEELANRLAALQTQVAQGTLALQMGARFAPEIGTYVSDMMRDDATVDDIVASSEVLNHRLRLAFNEQMPDLGGVALSAEDKRALARTVSLVFARDPHADSGSFQILVPQVSASLTASRADNVVEISHALLPALRGDYDGDKVRQLAQLVLDDTSFVNARSGAHFIGAGTSVNVGAPKYEQWIMEYLSQSLNGDPTLQAYATGTLTKIGTAVRNRYDGVIESRVVDSVLADFFEAVRANDPKARKVLLDGLADRAGAQITAYSRNNLSNEWLWIDQLIRSTMDEFQTAYATYRPQVAPDPDTDAPVQRQGSPEVRERLASRASTIGQTIGQWLAGDSMFRKFQKLHYTSRTSPVESAQDAGDRDQLYALASMYEMLGQGLTKQELDNIRGKDDITTRVYARLLKLAEASTGEVSRILGQRVGTMETLAVIANVKVADVKTDADGGVRTSGAEISLAQFLLRASVEQDQREKAGIIHLSPELQAKHERLLGMTRPQHPKHPVNAERAFVEVVGSQQFFSILGESSAIFGPQLTVEQWIRQYTSMSEVDRREERRKLTKNNPEYIGRKQAKNMPYELAEVVDGQITAYRAVVDAMIAVGSNRITIEEDGTLVGEFADRSNSTGKAFRDAHRKVRQALQAFIAQSPRAQGELTTETVQRMLEANPDFARQVMAMIPRAAAGAVFERREGNLFIANWVHRMFAIEDAKVAEAHYYRNVLLSEINALGVSSRNQEEEDDGKQRSREFSRLPRMMHRVVAKLAQEPNGLMLELFIRELTNATDLDAFIAWVNTTPGVRGSTAPLTAWVDDTAEYDKDKAQGGWTTALQGAELREAVVALQTGATNLVEDLALERASIAADKRVIGRIRRVIAANAGDTTVQISDRDRRLHAQFEETIRLASEAYVGQGPQAMQYQIVGAVLGFYPQAHTKGKTAENVRLNGAFDAQRDAFDYVTNYERMMASITTVNLDAVSGNMSELAKDEVRTMDDDGRTVIHRKPDVAAMLDLMEGADTRSLARSILFPQVMERGLNGKHSTQMLVGRSLKDLLAGASYKELFPQSDKLSMDSALRYMSLVEANARENGGHFSIQRAVNDYVIAQTSAADHVLSVYEIEQMVTKAMYEFAQIIQSAATVASVDFEQGTDRLGDILGQARVAQHKVRKVKRLGLDTRSMDAGVLADDILDQMVEGRRSDLQDEIQRLTATIDPLDADSALAVAAEVAGARRDLQTFEDKVQLLTSDDATQMVVDTYAVDPTAPVEAAKKDLLTEFVMGNLRMLEKASSLKLILQKMTTQVRDPARHGQLTLSDAEWAEVSRSVIAYRLDDLAGMSGSNISTVPYPDIGTEMGKTQARYFDTSYSYVLEPLMDSNGPIMKAAVKIHNAAGRQGALQTTDTEMIRLLDRTVFKEFGLGPWTSDTARASMEANARLDSAAAEAAIAMAGNSPKRQATIGAATRRSFKLPTEEMFSTVDLTWTHLEFTDFDDIEVTTPAGPRAMPKAQMNNRFIRSAVATYIDSEGATHTIDLIATDSNMARPFTAAPETEGSGLYEIHMDRVKTAVDHAATQLKISPDKLITRLEFLHPDTQPAEPGWYNNLYFEGTSFKLDADRHTSLNSTLWFTFGSISPTAQAEALDAAKLGMPALSVIKTSTAAERQAHENDFLTDFAGMLRDKTKRLLSTNLGNGHLDVEYYNAVYKDMKLRHFVQGTNEQGETVFLTAEQVIAAQAAGTDLGLSGAKLWVPSDDVLRTMLGEQGNQGVDRILDDRLEVDLANVREYQGVTPRMLKIFKAGVEGETSELADTRIANRARQQQLIVRAQMDDRRRSSIDQRIRLFHEKKRDVFDDRAVMPQRERGGFDPTRNLDRAVKAADKMLRSENISMDWSGAGIMMIGPRDIEDTAMESMLLHELHAVQAANQYRTGWIYRESSEANHAEGHLSEVSVSATPRAGLRVAPGDLVSVGLESFNEDLDLAKKRMDWLADNGTTIVLTTTDGTTDLRAPLAEHLVANGYVRVPGSGHVYIPDVYSQRYQNQNARASSLLEMRGLTSASRAAVLHMPDKPIDESAAWVGARNERLASVRVSLDLVPVDALAGFNVPVESGGDTTQVDRVTAHLTNLTEAEVSQLRERSNRHLEGDARDRADRAWDADFTRMIDRFGSNLGTVLPVTGDPFGTGDFIPLVDNHDNIVLYRHGYKSPHREQVDEQLARAGEVDGPALRIAIFPTKIEDAASTHRGNVVEFHPRSNFGLSVEMDIDLQHYGNKVVLEWNGMKYMLTPQPKEIVLPSHGFFSNGWGIDILASAHDMMSKESLEDLVDNHRNAFAFLGIDFTADVAKFFGVDVPTALDLLSQISRMPERITLEAADELLNAERVGVTFGNMLSDFANAAADKVDPAWVNRLGDVTEPTNRIVASLLVYLMTPGAQVGDVLKSSGLNIDRGKSVYMPRLFTQVFDNARIDSPLRVEINKRLNRQLYNPNHDGTGYSLAQDWTVTARSGAQQESTAISYGMVDGAVIAYAGPNPIGRMTFGAITGEIGSLGVMPAYRRKGVASGMLAFARKQGIKIIHSTMRTPAGEAWAQAQADGPLPSQLEMEQNPDEEDADLVDQLKYINPIAIEPTGEPASNLVGFLAFPELHAAGDNPLVNGMSFLEGQDQDVSVHSAAIAYGAIGAGTVFHDISTARTLGESSGIIRPDKDGRDGGVWRMMRDIAPELKDNARVDSRDTPAEAAYKDTASTALGEFRHPIVKTLEHSWDDKQRKDYKDAVRQVLHTLKLQNKQSEMVDYWVRQALGQPVGIDRDGKEQGFVNGADAIDVLADIMWNVRNGFSPVLGVEVPLLHLNDLQAIYRANMNRPPADRFNLKISVAGDVRTAETWDDWVAVSLGGALVNNSDQFDPMFLKAVDGMMHTYHTATRSMLSLPVSLDAAKSQRMLDPETNMALLAMLEGRTTSFDPQRNEINAETVLLDTHRATLEDLVGGNKHSHVVDGRTAPAAAVTKRRDARRRWRLQTNVPIPIDTTLKDLRKNGSEFVNSGTNTNALSRMLINLRVGTALLNPALYISMGPEQWIRGSLDRIANLMTGQATVGLTARAMAGVTERARDTKTGQALEAVGLEYRYSPDQLKKLRKLFDVMGGRNDFKAMVYADLMFLRPHMHGIGKVERWLEAYAKLGSRVQDPTWGMKADTMARRYVEAALQHLLYSGESNLSVDLLVDHLAMDPMYLKKNYPAAHTAATNSIAQIRSLKMTPLSLALKGIYEPLSASPNAGVNMFGNVVLKLPLLFSGYAMNVLTTITGMQGISDMVAMGLHGRTNGIKHPRTLMGRVQAKLRGEPISEDDEMNFDMTSVMEGIDLTRSFIRGGITHTGLFMAGMMAGGLGLSGEDDETRKRRRLSQLEAVPYLYDPRRIENDFRNADAIFLDWLPFGLGSAFQVTDPDAEGGARDMAQLNWTLKQFISPIMGFEKFYETGDFQNVTWGFEDALGSFPLINSLMWDDAVTTANDLAKQAHDQQSLGSQKGLVNASGFLTTAVGTYERMLFENAFVNQLYISMDRYDRNPYVLPLRDSSKNLQGDIEGNTRPNDLAFESYIDPVTGEVQQRARAERDVTGEEMNIEPFYDPETGQIMAGYLGRDERSATLHALTENRASMAFVMSMFTGFSDSDYIRTNMPIKTREMEKAPVAQAEAEAYVRAAMQGMGGAVNLTADEIASIIKNQARTAGDWDTYNQADALAAAAYKKQGPAPMSVLDKDGREVLTHAGAKGVMWGLVKGAVKLGDSSLDGVYITWDMRAKIQEEWTKEIVQEGIDMGLDQTKATSRMKRIWGGPYDNPQIQGIGDLLWSTDISYDDTAVYNQLNTTYVMGPDGRPWATGFSRGNLLNALGIQPVKKALVSEQGATGNDSLLNTTDLINGMNTGLRALELVDKSRYVPTDVEIGKAIEDAIAKAANDSYTPFAPYASSGSNYGGYGHSYGGYGGGGGYSSSGYNTFTRMYALPDARATYGNDIPFINTSNPLIRRGDVRRERVWSERGRLKQWQ